MNVGSIRFVVVMLFIYKIDGISSDFTSTLVKTRLPDATGIPLLTSLSAFSVSNPTVTTITVPPDYGMTNVTAQIGTNAYLPCKVKKILNKSVSWVRVRDDHILTVDRITFIADERFNAFYGGSTSGNGETGPWTLQIKYVQARDKGIYECQVSSEPKISARINLDVVVPRTEMIGDANRYVKEGSKVTFHCIVTGALDPPLYIIWYHGNQQIFSDNTRGWRSDINRDIRSENENPIPGTVGKLTIPSIKKRDSGNYTCSPSNSPQISVNLHVMGEYSASAITSSAHRLLSPLNYQENHLPAKKLLLIYAVMFIIIFVLPT